jgi:hypothetical protein
MLLDDTSPLLVETTGRETTVRRGVRTQLEVRAMRQQAATILENVLDMTRTLVRMGDASDWTDPQIPALDLEIRRYEEIREALLARACKLERGKAAA